MKQTWFIWLELLGLVVRILVARVRTGGVAEKPSMFSAATSLNDAGVHARESGKPTYLLVTADWCGPCQLLKRGALSDARVASIISEQTIPVYVEETTDNGDLDRLPVRSFPTSYIIVDGQIVSALEGNRGAADYAQWLERALTPAG